MAGYGTGINVVGQQGHKMSPGYNQSAFSANPASTSLVKTGADTNYLDWATWFGKPANNEVVPPISQDNRTSDSLPEAYVGDNKYLANTIVVLVFQNNSFLLRDIMPLTNYERPIGEGPTLVKGVSLEWSITEFNTGVMNQIPERGVVPMQTHSRTRGSTSFGMYGKGFKVEAGFMRSEMGRGHYKANLSAIEIDTQETLGYVAIMTILTKQDEWAAKQSQQVTGAMATTQERVNYVKRILENDIDTWDILKRKTDGIDQLDAQLSEQITMNRGRADTFIIPLRVVTYISFRSENVEFFRDGKPRGTSDFRLGADPETVSFLHNGNAYYKLRMFMVRGEEPFDPLRDIVQIGEWYAMYDLTDCDTCGYRTCHRDIQIFDEECDNWATIQFMTALKKSCRFDPVSGEIRSLDDPKLAKFRVARSPNTGGPRDFLEWIDADNNFRPARYMGHIMMTKDDLHAVTRTAYNAMEMGKYKSADGKSLHQIVESGLRALDVIKEATTQSEAAKSFWTRLGAQNVDNVGFAPYNKNRSPIVPILEVKANPFGSLDLPRMQARIGLPAGYGNYGGFKTISQRVKDAADFGLDVDLVQDVAEFTNAFDTMYKQFSRVFHGAPVVDPRYASEFYQRPTGAHTLFENVVQQMVGVPAFLRVEANAAGGVFAPSNLIGAESGLSTDNVRLSTVLPTDESRNKLSAQLLNSLQQFTNVLESLRSKSGNANDAAVAAIYNRITDTDAYTDIARSGNATVSDLQDQYIAKSIVAYLAGRLTASTFGEALKKLDAELIQKIFSNTEGLYAFRQDWESTLDAIASYFNANKGSFIEGTKSNQLQQLQANIDAIRDRLQRIFKSLRNPIGGYASQQDYPSDRVSRFGGIRGGESFYRAPLNLYPVQVYELAAQAAKNGAEMNVLPGDPENPYLYADPDQLFTFGRYLNPQSDNHDPTSHNLPDALRAQNQDIAPDSNLLPAAYNTYLASNSANISDGVKNSMQTHTRTAPPDDSLPTSRVGAYRREQFARNLASDPWRRQSGADTPRPRAFGFNSSNPDRNAYPAAAASGSVRTRGTMRDNSTGTTTSAGDSRGQVQTYPVNSAAPVSSVTSKFDDGLYIQLASSNMMQSNLALARASSVSPIEVMIAEAFLYTPAKLGNWEILAENNVTMPANILLFRLHAEYEICNLVKMLRGRDTNELFMAMPMFGLAEDVSHGEYTGVFKFKAAGAVYRPQNIAVKRGVFVCGYNHGMGVDFFQNSPEYYDPGNGIYEGDIHSILIPRSENKLPKHIPAPGYFFVGRSPIAQPDPVYSSAFAANAIWGFDTFQRTASSFSEEVAVPNLVATHGSWVERSTQTNEFTRFQWGSGHWSQAYTGPGKAAMRRGGLKGENTIFS